MTRHEDRPRVAAVDALRGAAVAGMVVFHCAWDLRWFGFVELDPSRSPGWQWFGHAVASTFLLLSGFSLVLAHRRGTTMGNALRRITVVAFAALVVTVATAIAAPDQMIKFGILHCIALSNLIALPLVDAPTVLIFGLAGAAAIAPIVIGGVLPQSLWWVGLSSFVPDTLDYRTILPWLCPVLLGVVTARLGATGSEGRVPSHPVLPIRLLAAAGRHSLGIYLIHQPIVLGCLFAIASLPHVGPLGATFGPGNTSEFLHQCQADCEDRGAQTDLCRVTCRCVLTAMVGTTDRPRGPSANMTSRELAQMSASCLATPSKSSDGGSTAP